jgi:N-acetylmuramoyl-L-alanine amidase
MRKINEIIIHCSATPEGKDYTVADIKKWHLQRGFNDIGYHYVIYRDGTYHRGRQDDVIGAHCTGHNANSIGICYIGGLTSDGKKSKDTRTEAQKKTLITLIRTMKARYPGAKVYSHKDFANKDCPCFDATKEYANI